MVINSRKVEIINMNIEKEQNCSIKDSVIKQGTYLARDGSLKLEFEERLQRAQKAVRIECFKIFEIIVSF